VPNFADRGVSRGQSGGSPKVVNCCILFIFSQITIEIIRILRTNVKYECTNRPVTKKFSSVEANTAGVTPAIEQTFRAVTTGNDINAVPPPRNAEPYIQVPHFHFLKWVLKIMNGCVYTVPLGGGKHHG
jgi:hypothetical protein